MSLRIRSRGHHPHWETDNGTYFVTFRLADSLPHSVLKLYEEQRRLLLRNVAAESSDADLRRQMHDLFSEHIETCLDQSSGECYMSRPEIADVVVSALLHFDQRRYDLRTWCVMPNHVHAVFKPAAGESLARIVHSWKSFTACRANKILGRTGAFWQREYYDHLIRDEQDEAHAISYVLRNPEMAGLKNWKWVGQGPRP
jgi:menaquinone-specific isochorismate synthase